MEYVQTFIEAIKIARQQAYANLTSSPLRAPRAGIERGNGRQCRPVPICEKVAGIRTSTPAQ